MVVTDLLNVSTLRLKFVHLFLQDYARSIIQTRNKYYLHLIKMESWLGTCKSIEHFIITDSLFLLLRNTYAKNWAGLTLIAILRLQLSKSFKNWILAWLTARKIEFSEVNNFLWKITYFLTNFISFIGTWTRLKKKIRLGSTLFTTKWLKILCENLNWKIVNCVLSLFQNIHCFDFFLLSSHSIISFME